MYKVVHKNAGKLMSCCVNPDFHNEFKVQYLPNQFVGPVKKGTKLYVFNTLEDAESMIYQYNWQDTHEIWKCEVVNPSKKVFLAYLQRHIIEGFFKDGVIIDSMDVPVGTRSADMVKLTKKVS